MDDTINIDVNVDLRVRELRESKGMSLQDLSDKAGISYNTALAYDRNSPRYFRRDVLAALAKALGVGVKDLFVE